MLACFEGVACTDQPAPAEGATCGPCPQGYTGDGAKCTGKFLELARISILGRKTPKLLL